MKYTHLLALASAAFAALQIDYAGLGGQQQYYKGMNIRAIHPWTEENNSGYKKYKDWDFAFSRLKNMTGSFNAVRTYSTQDRGINHLESIFPLVIKHDLMLLLGIYLNETVTPGYTGQERFQTEFAVLKNTTQRYMAPGILDHIAGITIGNEDMYQNWTNPEVIALEISQVKEWLEQEMQDTCTPVGHTDTWNALTQEPAKPVIEASDFLVANIFPYWEDMKIDGAKDQFARAVGNLTNITATHNIPIWVGETGWPRVAGDEASTHVNAIASVDNMQMYWKQIGCEVLSSMNAFYYIDEDVGEDAARRPTWGIWNDGHPVIDIGCGNGTNVDWSTGEGWNATGVWSKPTAGL